MEHKIKDQKVYVKLSSVTALQKRYQRSRQAYDRADAATKGLISDLATERRVETAKAAAKARMEAFEEFIAVMELPIS